MVGDDGWICCSACFGNSASCVILCLKDPLYNRDLSRHESTPTRSSTEV